MNKQLLFFFGLFFLSTHSFSQPSNNILFIIDSIPLLKDPEEWNQLLEEDISDIKVVKDKDSLNLLGFREFEGVTYIYTKEYRGRSDSLKKIPSLKQMQFENEVWNFHGLPYSGKYIDYFNNGKKLNEGSLLNGRQNGEFKIFYQNGSLSKQSFYSNGKISGTEISYYKSGTIRNITKYLDGKGFRSEIYYPNGQLESGNLSEVINTAISYRSNGKIKKKVVIKNGAAVVDPITEKINYLQNSVYQCAREGDFKNGIKYCNKIIGSDISNETAYFYKGEFFVMQNRFDEAIAEYDKAINIEPLLGYVLVSRAFARIKKYQSPDNEVTTQGPTQKSIVLASEIEKIFTDLQQAIYCDAGGKRITEAISKYCNTR